MIPVADQSEPDEASRQQQSREEKRKRLIELLLVLAIAVIPLIFESTLEAGGQSDGGAGYSDMLNGIWASTTSIALVAYVLSRSNRSLKSIGFTWQPRLLIPAALLFAVGMSTYYLWWYVVEYVSYFATGHFPVSHIDRAFGPSSSSAFGLVLDVGYSIAGPAFEEVIVRAYVQREATFLWGSPALSIALSVLLQTSYHFYQGWDAAVCYIPIFTIFAWYYQRTGCATPGLIAHIVIDVGSVIYYGR